MLLQKVKGGVIKIIVVLLLIMTLILVFIFRPISGEQADSYSMIDTTVTYKTQPDEFRKAVENVAQQDAPAGNYNYDIANIKLSSARFSTNDANVTKYMIQICGSFCNEKLVGAKVSPFLPLAMMVDETSKTSVYSYVPADLGKGGLTKEMIEKVSIKDWADRQQADGSPDGSVGYSQNQPSWVGGILPDKLSGGELKDLSGDDKALAYVKTVTDSFGSLYLNFQQHKQNADKAKVKCDDRWNFPDVCNNCSANIKDIASESAKEKIQIKTPYELVWLVAQHHLYKSLIDCWSSSEFSDDRAVFQCLQAHPEMVDKVRQKAKAALDKNKKSKDIPKASYDTIAQYWVDAGMQFSSGVDWRGSSKPSYGLRILYYTLEWEEMANGE